MTSLTVRDLLTEVGTLVGMYDNEYRIDNTPPGAEQVYCRELADNGHTNESLTDRWVVLQTSGGVWTQRRINTFTPSSNILTFQHSSGNDVVFQHQDATIYLFDTAAPELVLRTIIPAFSAHPHLAQFTGNMGLDLKALNTEYEDNKSLESPVFANTNFRMVDKRGTVAYIAISNINKVSGIRYMGREIPLEDWNWDYYGDGTLAQNGVLRIDSAYLMGKVEVIFIQTPRPANFGISDWSNEIVSLDSMAKESLKYHAAARWMQASLPARDENGWEYAKRTETHFRNRANELDVVLAPVQR